MEKFLSIAIIIASIVLAGDIYFIIISNRIIREAESNKDVTIDFNLY